MQHQTQHRYRDLRMSSVAEWLQIPPQVTEAYEKSCKVSPPKRMELYPWQLDALEQAVDSGAAIRNNLLYCAPTSGGKTLVAELLLLHSVFARKQRAIFVLPYVALVEEKAKHFKEILSIYNKQFKITGKKWRSGKVNVRAVCGDRGSFNVKRDDVIVCTVEKANAIFNDLCRHQLLHTLGCLAIDEAHILGEHFSGYLLELLLTKALYIEQQSKAGAYVETTNTTSTPVAASPTVVSIQLVLMSATMANIDSVADWLQAKLFTTDFRPVTLREFVDCQTEIVPVLPASGCTNRQAAEVCAAVKYATLSASSKVHVDTAMDRLAAHVWASLRHRGCQVIVFCPRKADCETTCQALVDRLYHYLQSAQQEHISTGPQPPFGPPRGIELSHRSAKGLTTGITQQRLKLVDSLTHNSSKQGMDRQPNKLLAALLVHGIAFHHSGLTDDERAAVEQAFKAGTLSVIAATPTLAAGVNLPAGTVIIKSLRVGMDKLRVTLYRQMVGRAGRAGFSTSTDYGEAVLLVAANERKDALSLVSSSYPPLMSQLLAPRSIAGVDKVSKLDGSSDGSAADGLLRLVVDVITLGICGSVADVLRFVGSTLRAYELDHQSSTSLSSDRNDFYALVRDRLHFLVDRRVLSSQTSQLKTHINMVIDPDALVKLDSSRYGKAAARCGMDPSEAAHLLELLASARKGVHLTTALHSFYLIVPRDPRCAINLRFPDFRTVLRSMETMEAKSMLTDCDPPLQAAWQMVCTLGLRAGLHVIEKPGVSEDGGQTISQAKIHSFANRLMKPNQSNAAVEEARVICALQRLCAARALCDFADGSVPQAELCRRYCISLAELDLLVREAEMVASRVQRFCVELGDSWGPLGQLAMVSRMKLVSGVPAGLLPLIRGDRPVLSRKVAVELGRRGVLDVAQLATQNPAVLADRLMLGLPYDDRKAELQLAAIRMKQEQQAKTHSTVTSDDDDNETYQDNAFDASKENISEDSGNVAKRHRVMSAMEPNEASTSLKAKCNQREEEIVDKLRNWMTVVISAAKEQLKADERSLERQTSALAGALQKTLAVEDGVGSDADDDSDDDEDHDVDDLEDSLSIASKDTSVSSELLWEADNSVEIELGLNDLHEDEVGDTYGAVPMQLFVDNEGPMVPPVRTSLPATGRSSFDSSLCLDTGTIEVNRVDDVSEEVTLSPVRKLFRRESTSEQQQQQQRHQEQDNEGEIPDELLLAMCLQVESKTAGASNSSSCSFATTTVADNLPQANEDSNRIETPLQSEISDEILLAMCLQVETAATGTSNALLSTSATEIPQPSSSALEAVGFKPAPMTLPVPWGLAESQSLSIQKSEGDTVVALQGTPVDENVIPGVVTVTFNDNIISCKTPVANAHSRSQTATKRDDHTGQKRSPPLVTQPTTGRPSPFLSAFTPSKLASSPGTYLYYPLCSTTDAANADAITAIDTSIQKRIGATAEEAVLQPRSNAFAFRRLSRDSHCQAFLSRLQTARCVSFELCFAQVPAVSATQQREWTPLVAYSLPRSSSAEFGGVPAGSEIEIDYSGQRTTLRSPHVLVGAAFSFGDNEVGYYLSLPCPLPPLSPKDHPEHQQLLQVPAQVPVSKCMLEQLPLRCKEAICRFVGFDAVLRSCPNLRTTTRTTIDRFPPSTTNALSVVSRSWAQIYRRSLLLEWRRGSCAEWRLFSNIMGDASISKVAIDMRSKMVALRERDVIVRGAVEDPAIALELLRQCADETTLKLPSYLTRLQLPVVPSDGPSMSSSHGERRRVNDSSERRAVYRAVATMRSMALITSELRNRGLEQLFRNIEMPLLLSTADAEFAGIPANVSFLSTLRQDVDDRLSVVNQLLNQHAKVAGAVVNVDSPKDLKFLKKGLQAQLTSALQQKGLPNVIDTVDHHPLLQLVHERRTANNLLDFLVKVMRNKLNDRVRAVFKPLGTATGRLIVSCPPLQMAPKECRLPVSTRLNVLDELMLGYIDHVDSFNERLRKGGHRNEWVRVKVFDAVVDSNSCDPITSGFRFATGRLCFISSVSTDQLARDAVLEMDHFYNSSTGIDTGDDRDTSVALEYRSRYGITLKSSLAGQMHRLVVVAFGYAGAASVNTVVFPAECVYRLGTPPEPSMDEESLLEDACTGGLGWLQSSRSSAAISEITSPAGSSLQVVRPRDGFKASEGYVFITADYSQIELRLLAHLCEDPQLLQIFSRTDKDADVFRDMAALWLKKPTDQVTPPERARIKQCCYAKIYGAGKALIADNVGISIDEAERILDEFSGLFPGIQALEKRVKEHCYQSGFAESIIGRRRFLPDIHSTNSKERQRAGRQAFNFICQGSAADLIKLAMINIHCRLEQLAQVPHSKPVYFRQGVSAPGGGLYHRLDSVRLVLQVHDELVYECRKDLVDEVAVIISDCMEHALALRVPLKVDVEVGQSWGQMLPWKPQSSKA